MSRWWWGGPAAMASRPADAPLNDTLTEAVRLALARPITLHPPLNGLGPTFRAVVSIAYHLQNQQPGCGLSILLPVHRLAEALGVPPLRISLCTGIATSRGLLVPEEGRQWRPGRGKRWQFNLASPLYTAPAEEAAR